MAGLATAQVGVLLVRGDWTALGFAMCMAGGILVGIAVRR